jgi:hypothetical protein
MKYINKVISALAIIAIVGACENLDFTEAQLVDPNNPSPDKASLNELYNNIQLEFNAVYQGAQGNPGQAARMYHNGAFTYRNNSPNTTFNGMWNNAYADLFPDGDALNDLAEGQNFAIHIGSAKIMRGYALLMLVDILGDVPLSEALQGTDVISPSVDPGSSVYDAGIALIDEGIAELNANGATAPKPTSDIFYNGDPDKWVTAANTIKFAAALNKGDVGTINGASNLIDAADEDFQFNYGSQRNNPDSRHPFYQSHYETGDGAYLSNYFMWLLRGDKETVAGIPMTDPRSRYYFYRKVDDAVGQDLTTYSCHFSNSPDQNARPANYEAVDPDMPYCYATTDGLIGRDHGNGEGTPPDGPIRTSYGLYPGGGDFDDDSFDDTRTGDGTRGGLGEGISPIFVSSVVYLMRAEAVLTLGATGNARTLLETGIRASLDKVESFESLVSAKMGSTVTLKDGSSGTVKGLYGMDQASKDAYVNDVLALYDAGSNDVKLDLVAKEQMIAAWGNGLAAYNMYRRTGKPNNMQPTLEPAGPFPLSFFYPATSVDRNANISQKAELDVPVFWQNASIISELY